jgi:hypothetical protein
MTYPFRFRFIFKLIYILIKVCLNISQLFAYFLFRIFFAILLEFFFLLHELLFQLFNIIIESAILNEVTEKCLWLLKHKGAYLILEDCRDFILKVNF